MISVENMSHVMKDYYLDVVAEQINKTSSPFFAKIDQTSEDVWGREVHKAIAYGINGGIGAGTETGSLPMANPNKYVVAKLPLKNLYGKIEISDKAIRASQNKDGSFVNLLNAEIEGLLSAAKFNMARMLFGSSDGLIGRIISISSNSNYMVFQLESLRSVMEGMVVDGYQGDDSSSFTKGVITAIDRASKLVTISGGIVTSTMTEGGYLTLHKAKGNELTGLEDLFWTGANGIYGISYAENPWIKAQNHYSKNFSIELIQSTIDDIELAGGSEPDMIICAADVRRWYLDELNATRRNIDYMNLDGGFKSLSYNGTPVVVDRFAEEKSMYFLNTADFKLHQLCDWRWLEGDTGKILKQIPGTATYTATLVKYADLLCSRPHAQVKLSNMSRA